jgi:exonuclease VII large subunit
VKRTLVILGLGALVAAIPAYAHHSFAKDYDEGRQISLEGEVTSFDLRSPHSWVYFTAKDSTGVIRQYGAEWANRSRLIQAGMSGETLRTGDHIVIAGAPNRTATEYSVHLKSIRRPSDGWSWPGGGNGGGQTAGRNFRRRR